MIVQYFFLSKYWFCFSKSPEITMNWVFQFTRWRKNNHFIAENYSSDEGLKDKRFLNRQSQIFNCPFKMYVTTLKFIIRFQLWSTVKLVYNNQPWDPKKWPLLTSSRCSEVIYVKKVQYGIMVVIGRWSLFGGGRKLRFDFTQITQSYEKSKFLILFVLLLLGTTN